jgi:hypothetical protein
MFWEYITPQGASVVLAFVVAILGGNAWITSALIDRKLTALNGTYVRIGECVLRSGTSRQMIAEDRDYARTAYLASVNRDATTQERIDELVQTIATRAAETILLDREILTKINSLLDRTR